MMERHLFLYGGSPPFGERFGKRFADLALPEQGKVAILFIPRDGWKQYMRIYTATLAAYGHSKFEYLPLTEDLEEENTNKLVNCSGIIISGGETEKYQERIVNTSIGKQINILYEQGVPVAGFSAGALLCPVHCIIPPIDNTRGKKLLLTGLGFLNDAVISVHYSKWQEENNLKTNVEELNVSVGYGLDDGTAAYFRDGKVEEIEGEGFYVERKAQVL